MATSMKISSQNITKVICGSLVQEPSNTNSCWRRFMVKQKTTLYESFGDPQIEWNEEFFLWANDTERTGFMDCLLRNDTNNTLFVECGLRFYHD